MAEVNITPLARRLAEENNVDWRRLQGSGTGGQITEGDVIDFLSRVMAGEEDVDSTPEPLPDGLTAWPGEAPPRESAAARASSQAPRHPEPSPFEPEIDEDIFLFEDDEASPLEGSGGTDLGGRVAVPEADGRQEFGWGAGAPAAPKSATENEGGWDLVEDEPAPAAPSWADGAGRGGSAGDSDGLEEAGEVEDDEGDFAIDLGWAEEPRRTSISNDESSTDDVSFDWGATDEDSGIVDVPSFDTGEAESESDPSVGEVWSAGFEDEGAEPTPWTSSDDVTPASDTGRNQASEWREGGAVRADQWEELLKEGVASDPPGAGIEELNVPVSSFTPAPRSGDSSGGDASAGPAASATAGAAPGSQAASHPSEEAGGSAEPPRSDAHAATMGGAAGTGLSVSVLRRRIEVGDLLAASVAVAEELGATPEAVRTALLLRAAARASRELGGRLGASRPALLRLDGDEPATFPVDLNAGFVDLVRECAQGGGTSVPPSGLLVADLSGLGLDDALLVVQGPLLTLGRAAQRSRGGASAYLSLSGGVPAVVGAHFLRRIEELLAAPVKLVV